MFEKYTGKNFAQGLILGGLASDGVILTLQTGQGGLFPTTFPFLLVIEKYNEAGLVTRREIVKCTNRVGDNLTIVRAFESCPADYQATTQTQTPFAFDNGDQVSLCFTAEDHKDIQDEVSRLETDKLNKSTYYAEQEVFSATVTGNDAYQITSSTVTTYNNGQTFKVQADVGNDGACTLQLNALGAKFIKKYVAGALVNLETGDISASQIFWATYNSLADCFQFSVDPATAPIVSVNATESTFTAGENITTGDALYVSNGAGGRTSGRVYKAIALFTTFSDAGNFIGFAKETITSGNSIKVLTAGVSGNLTGLTVGADYYLTNTAGTISTTPGTNIVSVGKAVSTTSVEINPLFRRNDIFGAYSSRTLGTNHQATESGIVVATSNGSTNNSSRESLAGYIGASNPANIFVAGDYCLANTSTTAYCSITFPVRKGQWYRVDSVTTGGAGFTMNFIPNV